MHRKILLASVVLLACVTSPARSEVRLPAIFGDHMVLQQGAKLPVWGWAEPGEKVTVSAAGQEASATAGADGKWQANLPPIKLSTEPIEVKVSGKNTIVLRDVLVGEVWLCSGQSGMAWPFSGSFTSDTELPRANYPQIRIFKMARKFAFEPEEDCEGKWVVCTPESVADFSGVGYYFARELHQKLGAPVGVIGSYCSASPLTSWVSLEALRSEPQFKERVEAFEELRSTLGEVRRKYDEEIVPAWEAQQKQWDAQVGKAYEKQLAAWNQAVKKARESGKPAPSKPAPKSPRPQKPICRADRPENPVVIHNGMIAPLAPYALKGVIWFQGESNANDPKLHRVIFPILVKDWRQKWGEIPFLFAQLPYGAGDDERIPLMREAQASMLSLPKTGMAATIDLGEPENPRIHPRNKRDVGLRLAHVARRVAYGQDLVSSGPTFKSLKIEGNKARVSFENIGGGLVIGAPPIEKDGEPPNTPDKTLKGFLIGGNDHKLFPAEAKIEGNEVVVWSEKVSKPVTVRYAWLATPEVNLYNKEQLPAPPFRSDNWSY